jgi:hypothetical protein
MAVPAWGGSPPVFRGSSKFDRIARDFTGVRAVGDPPLADSTPSPAMSRKPEPSIPVLHHAGSWSPARRLVASGLIAIWVTLVFLGPVTNPSATEELTAPLARRLAPLHQSLFLGHGYRFFAPDPGPAHRVVARVPGSEDVVWSIPDRSQHWPRLLYHRWFMLSETLWNERQLLPPREEFQLMQQDLAAQADRMLLGGERALASSLRAIHDRQELAWTWGNRRTAALTGRVRAELARRAGKTEVELGLQARLIPFPSDVVLGSQLSDSRYLAEPDRASPTETVEAPGAVSQ